MQFNSEVGFIVRRLIPVRQAVMFLEMLNVWRWYQNGLEEQPVKTQVISSGLVWGFGDLAAQIITHSTARAQRRQILEEDKLKINWKRVATTSFFGFAFVGPVGHFWYEGLDRFIRLKLMLHPSTFKFIAAKVVTDSLIFGPLDLLVFFSYMGFCSGKNLSQIKEDVKRDFIPALMMEGCLWPAVQVINFLFVPVMYQLLYVNFFCLVDSCFLSWFEQQEDADWKKYFKSFLQLKDSIGQDRQEGVALINKQPHL